MRYLSRRNTVLITGLVLLALFGFTSAHGDWPHVVSSRDGTPISYEVAGDGELTLVLIHGWSCDARYWREQVPVFSEKYRMVVVDLAGHGHSGQSRTTYSMSSFGEDVRAVADAVGAQRMILVGHSMGGPVAVEAARLMPGRVIGIIGVDTLENVEYPLTEEQFLQMVTPLKEDFTAGTRAFVSQMIRPYTDHALREWILSDMSSAPPRVALSAFSELLQDALSGDAAKVFESVRVPVISVNGDAWPINYEGNRKHMASYDAIVIEGADHFLMMNKPVAFNAALEQAIERLVQKAEAESVEDRVE